MEGRKTLIECKVNNWYLFLKLEWLWQQISWKQLLPPVTSLVFPYQSDKTASARRKAAGHVTAWNILQTQWRTFITISCNSFPNCLNKWIKRESTSFCVCFIDKTTYRQTFSAADDIKKRVGFGKRMKTLWRSTFLLCFFLICSAFTIIFLSNPQARSHSFIQLKLPNRQYD